MNTIRDNLTGQKFGHLVVIEQNGKTLRGQSIWKCQCRCGNFKNVRGYHLKGKKIRSCGCKKREIVNIKWQGYEKITRWLWNNFRCGANSRKIKFDITAKDMWDIAVSQNMKCMLTDEDLVFVENQKDKKLSNVSLDRIDSSKGYVKGNIQWVTKDVNVAKQSMTQENFINVCKRVALKYK